MVMVINGVDLPFSLSAVGRPPRLGRGERPPVLGSSWDCRMVLQRDRGAPVSRVCQQLHGSLPSPAGDLPGATRRPHQRSLLQGHQEDQTELQDTPKVSPLPQVVERTLLAPLRPPSALPSSSLSVVPPFLRPKRWCMEELTHIHTHTTWERRTY